MVNNEPCQLIEGDSPSPSQTVESKKWQSIEMLHLVYVWRWTHHGRNRLFSPPVMSAHFHPQTRHSLSLRACHLGQTIRKDVFRLAYFKLRMQQFPSHSSNKSKINTQDRSQMISMFINFIFQYPSLQVLQDINCSVSVKRQARQWQMLHRCLFFRQQLILTNDTTAKCGSYQCQAMSCHIQSHKTPCTLCHSSLLQSCYNTWLKHLTTEKQKHSVLGKDVGGGRGSGEAECKKKKCNERQFRKYKERFWNRSDNTHY